MSQANLCSLCNRAARPQCHQGEMDYADGSSRVCPNWTATLDRARLAAMTKGFEK